MTDDLASFWVHTVTVRRRTGSSAGGDAYDVAAPGTPLTGFYRDGAKLVTGPDGKQVTSSGQFAFPVGLPYVPVGSLVTVPAEFGGRTSKVIASAVGDGAGLPTPDHQLIALL